MSDSEEIEAAIKRLGVLREKWLVDNGNRLFVTLAATVEPQLAVLRAGGTATTTFPNPYEWVGESYAGMPGWAAEAKSLALPLAKAINEANS